MPLEVETLLLPEQNDILLNDVSEVSLKCIEDELGVHDPPELCLSRPWDHPWSLL